MHFAVLSPKFLKAGNLMIGIKNLVHRPSAIVEDICSSLIDKTISYASVGIIDGNTIYSAFSHKDWQDTYQNCSLHHHDPSFIGALQISSVPLFWDCVPIMTKKAAGIMQQRCEYTHISSGVTISFKGNNRFLLITLGANLDSLAFSQHMNNGIFENLKVRDILWSNLS